MEIMWFTYYIILERKKLLTNIIFNFSNTACNTFFTYQHHNKNGDSHLVSNACFNGEIHPLSINPEEKKLILLITNLSMVLTKDQCSLLTSILELQEDIVKKMST